MASTKKAGINPAFFVKLVSLKLSFEVSSVISVVIAIVFESGDVHFVFSAFQPDANLSQFRSLPLKSQEFGVMKADNPLANGELSIEKFIRASHGVVALTGRGPNLLDAYLQKQGYLMWGSS